MEILRTAPNGWKYVTFDPVVAPVVKRAKGLRWLWRKIMRRPTEWIERETIVICGWIRDEE